jgi:hypothetical protein
VEVGNYSSFLERKPGCWNNEYEFLNRLWWLMLDVDEGKKRGRVWQGEKG